MPTPTATWFPDRLSALLFTIVIVLWAASESFNTSGIRLGRRTPGSSRRDHGSYWIMLLVVWGSIIVSLLARAVGLGVFHGDLQYLALGVIVCGIALREWAVLSLGRSFTVVVTIFSGQMLVRRGPYRWIRHPAYSGNILSLVGFPLSLGTAAGGLLVLVLSLAGYLYRVRIEERALLEAFGDEYREYMQHTSRFFPGL